jgi:spore germination protein KC
VTTVKLYFYKNLTKAFWGLLLFTCLLLLTGCWDRTETTHLAIILATAIDKSDDQTKVSVQILVPQAAESDGQHGSSTGGATIVRSALGENVADAISKIQGKTSRKLFWGQCRVYIFGEKVAIEGLHDEIDFLVRHPEPRNRSFLFVSEGEAGPVLSIQPPLEGFIGKNLKELVDERVGVVISLKDFQQMITGVAGGAILPYINTETFKQVEETENETVDPILGSAIFKRDSMVGKIDQKMTRGVLWIIDELQGTGVTIKPKNEEGSITLDPIREHTEIIPKMENGKWKINIKIKAEGSIVQNSTDLDVMNPKVNKMLQKEMGKAIEKRINQALEQVQKEMKSDVFDFASAFERKYPAKWDEEKDRWDEIFPQVEVGFDLKTYVRRPGLSTVPGGLPPKQESEKK